MIALGHQKNLPWNKPDSETNRSISETLILVEWEYGVFPALYKLYFKSIFALFRIERFSHPNRAFSLRKSFLRHESHEPVLGVGFFFGNFTPLAMPDSLASFLVIQSMKDMMKGSCRSARR